METAELARRITQSAQIVRSVHRNTATPLDKEEFGWTSTRNLDFRSAYRDGQNWIVYSTAGERWKIDDVFVRSSVREVAKATRTMIVRNRAAALKVREDRLRAKIKYDSAKKVAKLKLEWEQAERQHDALIKDLSDIALTRRQVEARYKARL